MSSTEQSKVSIVPACLGLALLAAAAFLPAFQAGFVYDDHRFILGNPFLDSPLDWKALFLDPQAAAADRDPDIYRPLCTLSFFVERKLGNQGAELHHAVSFGLHMVNTILVLLLLMLLLGKADPGMAPIWPAFLGAALFAIHPLQVESVAWISSRGVLLSAAFSLAAVLTAFHGNADAHPSPGLRAGSIFRIFAAAALCLFSCLSKESGVMTGVFILLGWLALPRLRNRKVFLCGCGAAAAALLFMAFRSHVMEGALHQVAPHGGDRFTSILYGGFGCLYQVSLIFRPWFHNLDYQNGFFDGVPIGLVALGAAVYLLLAASALIFLRRYRLPALGILLLVAAQFPTSSLAVTLRSLVNDRYLYMPLAGFALIVAGLSAAAAPLPRLDRMVRVLLLAAAALLALETHDRSRDWIDSRSLWHDLVETRPDSPRGRDGLSGALLREKRFEEALEHAVKGFQSARWGTAARMNNMFKAVQALFALERSEQAENLLEQLIAEAESPYREEDFRQMRKACRMLLDLKIVLQKGDEQFDAAERLLRHQGELPPYLDQRIRESLERDR